MKHHWHCLAALQHLLVRQRKQPRGKHPHSLPARSAHAAFVINDVLCYQGGLGTPQRARPTALVASEWRGQRRLCNVPAAAKGDEVYDGHDI